MRWLDVDARQLLTRTTIEELLDMIRCNWTEDEQSLIQSKTKWNRIVLVCDLHSAFPLMIIFAKDADGNISCRRGSSIAPNESGATIWKRKMP
jgi:hypothetical protein